MSERKPRLRWRREPSEKGLARICQGPRGYDLIHGDEIVIRARPLGRSGSQWYWYGCGQNTHYKPVATEEAVKAEAMAFFKSQEPTK